MTLFPSDPPDDGLTPTSRFRWVRRVSPPNEFGVGYREKVLQQWFEPIWAESLMGQWRDVPVEEGV